MSLTRIAVGDKFNLIKGRDYTNKDGCILELLSDGELYLIVFLNKLTNMEKKLLKEAPIKVSLFKDTPAFKLFTLQYGNSDLVFEINFNPLLYTDERKELIFKNNMINIIGVDSSDYIIQTLRYANLPKKMYLEMIEQYQKAKEVDNYNNKFENWYNDLLNRYTTLQLHNMGKYIGKLGEDY